MKFTIHRTRDSYHIPKEPPSPFATLEEDVCEDGSSWCVEVETIDDLFGILRAENEKTERKDSEIIIKLGNIKQEFKYPDIEIYDAFRE